MEQNFQTSFIPKKPMIEERATASRPVGLLTISSMFLFFTVLLASGGLYFYQGILTKNLASMQTSLDEAKDRFEPAKITQLQVLDTRLRAASQVLSRHITISPIFQMLEGVTMKTVRYTKFSYDLGTDPTSPMVVKLSGTAVGYRSIALQSDLFTQKKEMIDPVFSNLSLDDKGNVEFDLQFSVDQSFINYEQVLKTQTAAAQAAATTVPVDTSSDTGTTVMPPTDTSANGSTPTPDSTTTPVYSPPALPTGGDQ